MDSKAAAREVIGQHQEHLVALSHRIHAHPELGFEEEQAAGWLQAMLADAGFQVRSGICDLPTAFEARAGSGPLHVAICAEYDALPAIGHACGHNIIAATAVGAAQALARVADDAGLTVFVIGTPAEEGGGGKIELVQRGAFADAHFAMMVHPYPYDIVDPLIVAASSIDVSYTGKESHAAAAPELGINAADALTVAQTAIGLLRQHLRPTDRVHGIVTHGGDAPNIVPAHTSARYMVRAETLNVLGEVQTKVLHCFEAGALATGATLAITDVHQPYAHMEHDMRIAALYQENALALGRTFPPNVGRRLPVSTDMGNVSLALPSIHPMVDVGSLPFVNHQPEFAAACITPEADRALVDAALAMAWTALDVAAAPQLREQLLARSA